MCFHFFFIDRKSVMFMFLLLLLLIFLTIVMNMMDIISKLVEKRAIRPFMKSLICRLVADSSVIDRVLRISM